MSARGILWTNILGMITIHEGSRYQIYQPSSIKGRHWVLNPSHMGFLLPRKIDGIEWDNGIFL